MIEINYIYTIEGGLYSLIIDYFKRKVTFFFFLISMKFGQVNRHNGRRYPYPRGNGRIVRNKLSKKRNNVMFNDAREDGRRIVETKVETSTEIDHGINLVRENLCILEVSRSLAVLGSIPPCD